MKHSILSRAAAALLCVALLLVCLPVPQAAAASSEKLDALKSRAADLAGRESSLNGQLSDLSRQENAKLQEKAVLEQQISVLSAQVMTTEELIAEYDVQIADKQVELDQAQAEEEAYYALFCRRFRDMEEQGGISYWSILFTAASFSDFLDRAGFVADVVRYDNMVVDQLTAARDAVAEAKQVLEEEQEEQKAAIAELEEEKAGLEEAEAAVDSVIAQINSQQDVYAAQLADIAAQEDDLEDQIAAAQKEYDAAVAAEKAAAAKKKAEEEAAKKKSSSSNTGKSGKARIGMIWPCDSRIISSPYGGRNSPTPGASSFHRGIDIAAAKGSSIYAAASGTVTEAGYNSARGNYVVISHASGVTTAYMHCSAVYVSVGQYVSQGSVIAAVGSTGISTGPHLHFGVMEDGNYVNPRKYI